MLYRRGTEQAFRAAIAPLEQAIAMEPDYVDALIMLGFVYSGLWSFGYEFDEDHLRRAERLARSALEIDDRNPGGHRLLGDLHLIQYDLSAAEAELQLAIERGPRQPGVHTQLGALRIALGDVEDGLRLVDEAVSLDPLGFMWLISGGHAHARVGRPEHAVSLLKRAIEVVPSNPQARWSLAQTYYEMGQEAEALGALIAVGFPPEAEGAIREAYGERGMTGAYSVVLELQQASSGLECTDFPSLGVQLLTFVERHEEALRCIEGSVEQRTLAFEMFLKVDPLWEPLRDDPRFQVAMEKMGLAD
jgi:tetratricopeptide (TPR) repeat protein